MGMCIIAHLCTKDVHSENQEAMMTADNKDKAAEADKEEKHSLLNDTSI